MLNPDKLINAVRANRDQLRQAILDRDRAWLALARIATSRQLKVSDLQRIARGACPFDPWDFRIALEEGAKRLPSDV